MYKLKYDFRQYNNVIATYIDVLINNSMAIFQQQIRNGQVKNIEHDSNALAGCIQNLEEYLYYNFKKSPETFNHIINATMNNVRTISVLPKDNRGIFGETQPQNKIIYINPDLRDSKYLTGEERTRLYMAHELGHIVNNEWMKKVVEYANQQIRQGRLTQDHAQLSYEDVSYLHNSKTYLERLRNVTAQMRDYREPFDDGYGQR